MFTETAAPQDYLFDLIREHQPDQVEHIWGLLGPYYTKASEDSYVLKPKAELDEKAIKDAIQQALGLAEVPTLVFFETSVPSQPNWMADEVWIGLKGDLKSSFREGLRASLQVSLGAYLRSSLTGRYGFNFGTSFQVSLWDRLWEVINPGFFDNVWDIIWDTLGASLLYWLDYLMTGQQDQATNLQGLVQLQTDCLILGTKKGESNTWIVVSA